MLQRLWRQPRPSTRTAKHGRRQRSLQVEALETRAVPAVTFRITSMTAGDVSTVAHDAVTGDDWGGIAVSGSRR